MVVKNIGKKENNIYSKTIKMTLPKVSVIITTKNGEDNIENCLKSVKKPDLSFRIYSS